jgi:hypothetical protein
LKWRMWAVSTVSEFRRQHDKQFIRSVGNQELRFSVVCVVDRDRFFVLFELC